MTDGAMEGQEKLTDYSPSDYSSCSSSVSGKSLDPDDPRWHHSLPPNHGVWDSVSFPFWSFMAWLRLLSDNFDGKFVRMVFFGEHLLKGMLGGGGGGGFLVIEGIAYMQLQVGASRKVLLMAVSSSAWSLKPVYGLLSDALIIRGYRRTPWIIMTASMASLGYLTLFYYRTELLPVAACICFCFAKMQLSWTDLMIEATYSEKIQTAPRFATDIVSWVWSGIGVCSIIGVLVAGPGLDLFGPFRTAALALPISMAIIVPACLGWLTEPPHPTKKWGVQWGLLQQRSSFFLCTLVLTGAVIVSAASGIAHVNIGTQALLAVVCSLVVAVAAMCLLPSAMWRPMIFMFLANALSINTYGFVDNFYLDAATAEDSKISGYPICADCPHFSNTFYVTVVGVCDSVFMATSSWMFNSLMSKWTYRRALMTTQVVLMFVSLVDVIQFQRLNKAYGIPDEVFMLGKAAVQNTCSMLNFMPTTILISKLCPSGVESTAFALLAGFSNFGSSISGYLGAYALDWLGLGDIGSGTTDDFSNAWQACVVNSCVPVAVLLTLPFLIPDARMCDSLSPTEQELEQRDPGISDQP